MANNIIRGDIEEALELSRLPESENLKIYVGSMVLLNEVLVKMEVKEGKTQDGNPFQMINGAEIKQNSQLYKNHYIAFRGTHVVASGNILNEHDYEEWKKSQ